MLRRPKREEFDALVTLWHDGWRDGHLAITPPDLAAHRTRPVFVERLEAKWDKVLVAGPDGAPEGFARLIGDELDQFYVTAVARGTGFAARFIAALEMEFLDRGVTRPWLICSLGNDRAARFYEESGWVNTGEITGRAEIPGGAFDLPCLRFEKTLPGAGSPARIGA